MDSSERLKYVVGTSDLTIVRRWKVIALRNFLCLNPMGKRPFQLE